MKRFVIRAFLLLAMLILASAAYLGWALSPVGGPLRKISVAVPKGASTRIIAARLKQAGAIRSAEVFVVASRFRGVAGMLHAGQYDFRSDMGLLAVMDKIARGEVSAVWVTIPEGYTGRQIATLLARRKLVSYQDFMLAVYAPRSGSSSLEGYLFPDTYLIPLQTDAKSVVQLMLGNFSRQVQKRLQQEITSSGWSLPQIVTIASMIEREARVGEDRPLIASVIYNRLRLGMPLQIDATVQYALGAHRSRLFFRDLRVDSPYNTYRHKGLPPGPIANPGLNCFEAALHPADTDYLYYVAGPDGRHVFSRNADEHAAAIRKVRSGG